MVYSQNLLPNFGFEVYDTCPNQLKKVASQWQNIEYHPDLYNSCAAGNTCSVPNNYLGYQPAHSGCGYEGMFCFDSNGPNAREFLQAKLDSTLIPGKKYYVSVNLSLFDGSPGFWSGTNKFGCKLSTNSFGPGINDGSPAIDNTANFYSDSIVIDTVSWTTIRGSFVADSVYNYIAFGCFFDDQHVQQIVLNGPRILTYYYLDDVCLSSDSMTCISVSQSCYVPNGIEYPAEKNKSVYPNPFNDVLKMTLGIYDSYQVTLYSVDGKAVLKQDFNLDANINTTSVHPGLYFYRITSHNSVIKTGKLLKE